MPLHEYIQAGFLKEASKEFFTLLRAAGKELGALPEGAKVLPQSIWDLYRKAASLKPEEYAKIVKRLSSEDVATLDRISRGHLPLGDFHLPQSLSELAGLYHQGTMAPFMENPANSSSLQGILAASDILKNMRADKASLEATNSLPKQIAHALVRGGALVGTGMALRKNEKLQEAYDEGGKVQKLVLLPVAGPAKLMKDNPGRGAVLLGSLPFAGLGAGVLAKKYLPLLRK